MNSDQFSNIIYHIVRNVLRNYSSTIISRTFHRTRIFVRSFNRDTKAEKAPRSIDTKWRSKGTSEVRPCCRAAASGATLPSFLASHNPSLSILSFLSLSRIVPSLLYFSSTLSFFLSLPSTLRPRSSFSTALVPVLTPVQAAAVVPTLLPWRWASIRADSRGGKPTSLPKVVHGFHASNPTQPKPSLAQPGTRPIRTYTYIYTHTTRACIQRDGGRERENHITWLRLYRYKHVEVGQRKEE